MAYIYDLTDTWNAGGTTFNAIKMNVTDSASAAGSKLVTLQTNGTEHFSVTKAGAGYFSGNVGIGTAPAANIRVYVRTAAITDTAYYADNGFNSGFTVKFASSLTSIGNDFGSPLAFLTNNSERMRIDASGNVGIGTSSPIRKFSVQSGDLVISEFINTTTSAYLDIADGIPNTMRLGSFGGVIGIAETATTIPTMAFVGGNVGLGTTGPQAYSNYRGITVEASTGAFLQLRNTGLTATLETAATPSESYVKTIGSQALWFGTNNTERMRIDSSGNVGIGTSSPGYTTSGRTTVYLNGTSSSLVGLGVGGTEAGYIGAFSSTAVEIAAAGASRSLVLTTNGAERARIDTSGNLLVGTTSVNGLGGTTIAPNYALWNSSSDNTTRLFFQYNSSTIGSVTTTATATAYNTSSDYRLKDIDGPITNSGAYIDALRPVQGSWKADGSRFIGLLAHEVQEVSETPIATGEKDGEEMQAMDYSAPEIIANLIAEIQSLRARVAQLEGN